jgi:hypothetical protein
MLLPQQDIQNQKTEIEQALQLEMIQLKQKHNAEKTMMELDIKRMKSEKEGVAKDLENFANETGHKRKVLIEEVETLVVRRDAEERRLNTKKPDYEVLFADLQSQIKSLETRERTLSNGLDMVRSITSDLEIREKSVSEMESFYKGIEGDSFVARLNKLKNKN